MTDPPREEKPERWRRFTLLDMLLIQAALAVGLSITSWVWPTERGWIGRMLAAVTPADVGYRVRHSRRSSIANSAWRAAISALKRLASWG